MVIGSKPVASTAIYIRTAHNDAPEERSVRAQFEACTAVASAHGWTIAGIYTGRPA